MKMQEMKELNQSDLEFKLADSLDELYNLRFQHAMHQLDNPLRLRVVKKDIARLKTILNEYGLGLREGKKEQK